MAPTIIAGGEWVCGGSCTVIVPFSPLHTSYSPAQRVRAGWGAFKQYIYFRWAGARGFCLLHLLFLHTSYYAHLFPFSLILSLRSFFLFDMVPRHITAAAPPWESHSREEDMVSSSCSMLAHTDLQHHVSLLLPFPYAPPHVPPLYFSY